MNMLWFSFRLSDNAKLHYFYTDESAKVKIESKDWFNKNTDSILIYKGFETEEYGKEPISKTIYIIKVCYHIENYFGDKSGCHFRSKSYVLYNGVLYKESTCGEPSKIVSKMTKELKHIMEYTSE